MQSLRIIYTGLRNVAEINCFGSSRVPYICCKRISRISRYETAFFGNSTLNSDSRPQVINGNFFAFVLRAYIKKAANATSCLHNRRGASNRRRNNKNVDEPTTRYVTQGVARGEETR